MVLNSQDLEIDVMKKLLNKNEVPEWFNYSPGFLRIVDQKLLDFDPWIILVGDQLRTRYDGIKDRYPDRDLIPFARREDCDDVACWDFKFRDKVVVIHDFSSSGFEGRDIYDSFWDWLRSALEETIDYEGD